MLWRPSAEVAITASVPSTTSSSTTAASQPSSDQGATTTTAVATSTAANFAQPATTVSIAPKTSLLACATTT